MSAVQLIIPGIVPNPFVPLGEASMPTTVVPSTDPIQLPSSGELHIHFIAVYADTNSPPTADKLTFSDNNITATAIGPFDWKKTANGDYVAIVQFNYDSPLALTGQTITPVITDDSKNTFYSVLADSNDMTKHFSVFHGLAAGGGQGYLPSTSLTGPTLPAVYQGTITLKHPVQLLTVYCNKFIPVPSGDQSPPLVVNGTSIRVSPYVAATSPFLSTMGSLGINMQKLPPIAKYPATITIANLPTALGGFVHDKGGQIYYSVEGSTALDSTGGRQVGPVTSACPNCYDIHCPMADMMTGNCATTRVDATTCSPDPNGKYGTLAACQALCKPYHLQTFSCVNEACTPDSNGMYDTLAACQAICKPLHLQTFSCSNGVCSPDPNGKHGTVEACYSACPPVKGNYSCDGNGICNPDPNGKHTSRDDCVKAGCKPTPHLPPTKKSKTGLIIGITAGVLLLIIIIAVAVAAHKKKTIVEETQ